MKFFLEKIAKNILRLNTGNKQAINSANMARLFTYRSYKAGNKVFD
jgi:hypothetical protein